jgi:hypothetical protein
MNTNGSDTEYVDGGEQDIVQIANILFLKKPQPARSVQLGFEGLDLKQIHEELLIFFTLGMKSLFSDSMGRVNLANLSDDHFSLVNQYFNSIGFNVYYKVYTESQYDEMIKFATNNSEPMTQLDHFRYKLKTNDYNIIYVIYFSLM